MSRCKACDSIMSEEDCIKKFPPNSLGKIEYSDLCGSCFETVMEVMYDGFQEVTDEFIYTPHSLPTVPEDWQ